MSLFRVPASLHSELKHTQKPPVLPNSWPFPLDSRALQNQPRGFALPVRRLSSPFCLTMELETISSCHCRQWMGRSANACRQGGRRRSVLSSDPTSSCGKQASYSQSVPVGRGESEQACSELTEMGRMPRVCFRAGRTLPRVTRQIQSFLLYYPSPSWQTHQTFLCDSTVRKLWNWGSNFEH